MECLTRIARLKQQKRVLGGEGVVIAMDGGGLPNHEPSRSYDAEIEHVGISPTRQAVLASKRM